MLQYPFVLAFSQARARNTPQDQRPDDKSPELAALDEGLLDPNVPTGITASAKEDEEKLKQHARSSSQGQDRQASGSQGGDQGEQGSSQSQGESGWSEEDEARHKDPEVLAIEQLQSHSTKPDYGLNEGEQLIMQARLPACNALDPAAAACAHSHSATNLENWHALGTAKYVHSLEHRSACGKPGLGACTLLSFCVATSWAVDAGLPVQMMTDEMRMAGFNQVNYALATLLLGALDRCRCNTTHVHMHARRRLY